MNRFLDLLVEFQALPRTRRTRTFMEVSGYPHYENVCSNVLGFFFDPKEEHGMGTLLLTAFFKMVKEREIKERGKSFSEPSIPMDVSITREHPAEDQKRIDLVIDSETFTIGIENKIYHWEANDFENYSRVIERLGIGKTTVKAVLCLYYQVGAPQPSGSFVRYTYAELWSYVRDLLGHCLSDASPKWATYLTDFMTTTARLAGENAEEKEVTDFFIKNFHLIEQLVNDHRILINRLDGYNRTLETNLRSELKKHECITDIQVYEKVVFAVDFLIQGHTLVLDLARNGVFWRLRVFDRPPESFEFLCRFGSTESMQRGYQSMKYENGSFYLQTWDIHVTQIELQDAILKAVDAFLAAIAELAAPESGKSEHKEG